MSAEKKQPERRCVGCGLVKPKKELIRVVRDNEGNTFLDETGRKNGRGAYLCKDVNCLNKAVKNKGLSRSLKAEIDDGIYDELRKEFDDLG